MSSRFCTDNLCALRSSAVQYRSHCTAEERRAQKTKLFLLVPLQKAVALVWRGRKTHLAREPVPDPNGTVVVLS